MAEAVGPARDRKLRDGDRTRRAGLTGAANVLRQASRLAVVGLTTPVLIRGLGIEQYGFWLTIQQTVSLAVLIDMRTSGTLKFSLATRQDTEDPKELRRQVGGALEIWARLSPLLVLVLMFLVFVIAPQLERSETSLRSLQWAFGIAFTALALERILSVPAQALRGMNLDYRAVTLDAATLTVGPVLAAFAAHAGHGLVGVAIAGGIGVLFANAGRFVVARRALPWFGAARASHRERQTFRRLSAWLVVGDLAGLLLLGTELLVVGTVVGPEAAAVYGTTQFIVRTVGPLVVEVLASGGPGVAQLAGRGDRDALRRIREETMALAGAASAALGAGVLVANSGFVTLWAGDGLYGGHLLDALLVAGGVVLVLIRTDAVLVDAALHFRDRALRTLLTGVPTILAMAVAGAVWDLKGVAVAALLGRSALLALMPGLVSVVTEEPPGAVARRFLRPLVTAAGIMVLGSTVGSILSPQSWLEVVVSSLAAAALALALFLAVGLDGALRERTLRRVTSVGRLLKPWRKDMGISDHL